MYVRQAPAPIVVQDATSQCYREYRSTGRRPELVRLDQQDNRCIQKEKRDCNPAILVGKKPGRLASQEPPRSWGGAHNLHVRGGISTSRRGVSTSCLKKEKKDSGRRFGWPFWPMQAGPGRSPCQRKPRLGRSFGGCCSHGSGSSGRSVGPP